MIRLLLCLVIATFLGAMISCTSDESSPSSDDEIANAANDTSADVSNASTDELPTDQIPDELSDDAGKDQAASKSAVAKNSDKSDEGDLENELEKSNDGLDADAGAKKDELEPDE